MTVLAAHRKNVIALVPASRIWAIVCLALAVPMVTVTVALASDKAQAAVVIAGEAVFYAAIMLFVLRRGTMDQPAPRPVSRAELPPVTSIWRQVAVYGSLAAALYAGLTWWGLAQHPQSVASVGIALAAPALTWFQYSRVWSRSTACRTPPGTWWWPPARTRSYRPSQACTSWTASGPTAR
ncbi:MAG: hypothetical protein ACR2MP_01845 [Streptosporangiaceae bacterium]